MGSQRMFLMAACCVLFGICLWALLGTIWSLAPMAGMLICSTVGSAETTAYYRGRAQAARKFRPVEPAVKPLRFTLEQARDAVIRANARKQ
jgi:hypothetical protein